MVLWYGMVWYGMVWYGMVWYGMVWYGMVWYGIYFYWLSVTLYLIIHSIESIDYFIPPHSPMSLCVFKILCG